MTMTSSDNLLRTPNEFVDENILAYLYILELIPEMTSIFTDEQTLNVDDIFENLAIKYSPIFIFHSDEKYYPAGVNKLLPHIALYYDEKIITNFGHTTEQLLSKGNNIKIDPNFYQTSFDLKEVDNIPLYIKINVSLEYIDIIYILNYAYDIDTDISSHNCCYAEGSDNTFHVVIIRLDVNNKNPLKVFYGEKWYPWEKIKKYNNNIITYVAKFSHRMYPSNSTFYRKFGLNNDKTNNGIIWKPKLLQIVNENNPLFMLYEGNKSMKRESWWTKIPEKSKSKFKIFFSL